MSDCKDCPPRPPASAASRDTTQPQDVLDASTFSPPHFNSEGELPRVVIEFCDRCRWLHRASWTQTELFLTFPPTAPTPEQPNLAPGLRSITLVPRNAPETGGRFRVWLLRGQEAAQEQREASWGGWDMVYDRKIEGGFPEMKDLKQRIRNLIAPSKDLGHSDKPSRQQPTSNSASSPEVNAAATGKTEPTPQDPQHGLAEARSDGRLIADDFAPRFRAH
ncbi:hypothetical protein JCM11641_002983 [Rhodosporidiobolus odoratus]